MADETEQKKSSCGCCILKILGVFVLLGVIAGAAVGYCFYQVGTWAQNAEEAAPVVYAPLNTSAGEQEDVDRLILRLQNTKADKTMIDETITPAVFNGIIDKIMKGEKEQGKEPEFLAFRTGLDGEHFTVAATKKIINKQGETKFVNLQVTFDCEIEDGKVTKLKADKIIVGGKDTSATVKTFVNFLFNASINDKSGKKNKDAPDIRSFKLLKREGDRVHIILDPTKFKQNEGDAPAPKIEIPSDPKKESF